MDLADWLTAIIAFTSAMYFPLFLKYYSQFQEWMETAEQKRAREKRAKLWEKAREEALKQAEKDGVEFEFDQPKFEERPFYKRIPEDVFWLFLIVGNVGLLVSLFQSPYLLTEAGRAGLAERGLLVFVTAYTIGFKGFMIPFGTYKFMLSVPSLMHKSVRVFRGQWNELLVRREVKRALNAYLSETPPENWVLPRSLGQGTQLFLGHHSDDL